MVSHASMANAIRTLAIDAVQQANSGHPGMPMGMADVAVALWHLHLRHNPSNPQWVNRDRFVLSNGHGSMLLYSVLHLTGYELSIDDLKQFRQLHSKTPGHPEYGYTPGVETTTGPLGQGLANAVGMALAEKVFAKQFNRGSFTLIDHYTYVFVGDGCLMEGISHEVCSLAGTLGLNKLIVFYDDNGISIDGHVKGWFTDNTPQRFEAYGWHVIPDVDGHNVEAVDLAIQIAKTVDKPTLICCKTIIGKGSPNKQGSHDSHGAPLGVDEIKVTRTALNWNHTAFEIPEDITKEWNACEKGKALESQWNKQFLAYQEAYPELAAEMQRRLAGHLPDDFNSYAAELLKAIDIKAETIATRKASQNVIQAFADYLPELIGGSADLAGSNLTLWKGAHGVSKEGDGNYIYYGVREFGMAAMMNGMVLHGGFRIFSGTFLMFSEYARNALRMAALMKINPIFVFTHDSIGLGEDGPTHQPIEQLTTLRLIPNMDVWRPADTAESLVAWQIALEHRSTPSCLIFSRQNLAYQAKSAQQLQDICKGAYILKSESGPLEAVLIATGSEVDLAVKAQINLAAKGIHVRVVSMPSTYMFDQQDNEYKNAVLPQRIPRIAIEAGVTPFWRSYVGLEGDVIGIDTFGESAPASTLFEHFGLTVEHIIARTCKAISNYSHPSIK